MPRANPWAGSTRKETLPADWERLRQACFKRDGYRCTWFDQGQRCPAPATDCDHINDRNDHSLRNLRSLCGPHHARRTSKQAHEAKKAMKALGRLPEEPQPGIIDGPPTPTKYRGF